MVRAGLVVGSGGNLSARVPGTDEFWMTATGSWLDRLDRAAFTMSVFRTVLSCFGRSLAVPTPRPLAFPL